MSDKYLTYATSYTKEQIAHIIGRIERAVYGEERDLVIVSCIIMSLCLSDPDITKDEERFHNAVADISQQIGWVLTSTQMTTSPEETE